MIVVDILLQLTEVWSGNLDVMAEILSAPLGVGSGLPQATMSR
jgi:hypothetical protein